MSEKIENRCWDCPNRRGLSGIAGKLACKFWEKIDFTGQRTKSQRGDCSGAVPELRTSRGSTLIIVGGDTVTHETEWYDTYVAACPKDFDTPPASPDEVETAMRVNHLDVFTHERVYTRTESLADYERQKAERMRELFEKRD